MAGSKRQAKLEATEALFQSLVTPPITPWKLVLQAKADFWAKEVQTGYTYTYVWMTNQFGHFNLGFLPSLLAASPPCVWSLTRFSCVTDRSGRRRG